MKIPRNYFESLNAQHYREYLKLLPDVKREQVNKYTALIFTFAALSFFGIFAINPTLSTIVELKRQLADSKLVDKQLRDKILNLGKLSEQYNVLGSQLTTVQNALPDTPSTTKLMGEIRAIAKNTNVTISSIKISGVPLSKSQIKLDNVSSFEFTVEASGNYNDLYNFSTSLVNFDRLVTLEIIGFNKDVKSSNLVLDVTGRVYYY